MTAFSSLGKSWANGLNAFRGQQNEAISEWFDHVQTRRRWERLADLCNVLVCIWGKRGNVDQASHLRVISCLGDYHSTIGMAYEDYRAIFCGDCALGCSNIFSERG